MDYNSVLQSLLDRHAPVTTTTRRQRKSDAWFDDECRMKKRETRHLERKFKGRKGDTSRVDWLAAQKDYRKTMAKKRSGYWQTKIESERCNPRRLWRSLKLVSGDDSGHVETDYKADDFANFFQEKIEKVRSTTCSVSAPDIQVTSHTELVAFDSTTVDEVCKLIQLSPNKQCSLDPTPTWLVKDCKTTLISTFPDSLVQHIVSIW